MGQTVGDLRVLIRAEMNQYEADMKKARGVAEDAGKSMSSSMIKAGKGLSDFGSSMTRKVSLPIAAASVAAIKFASDMEETTSKINVVFGDSADEMMSWSQTAIESMGLADQTALDMAATYGDMATSFDFTAAAAADMGQELVGRAADLASFKNISIDVANTALTGVFTGETESLKQLGVIMTQTNLDNFALAQGMKKTTKEMSQQELVSLRLAYVMRATDNAAGDFARTSDSTANQARKAKEQLKEMDTARGIESDDLTREWVPCICLYQSLDKEAIFRSLCRRNRGLRRR